MRIADALQCKQTSLSPCSEYVWSILWIHRNLGRSTSMVLCCFLWGIQQALLNQHFTACLSIVLVGLERKTLQNLWKDLAQIKPSLINQDQGGTQNSFLFNVFSQHTNLEDFTRIHLGQVQGKSKIRSTQALVNSKSKQGLGPSQEPSKLSHIQDQGLNRHKLQCAWIFKRSLQFYWHSQNYNS